MSREDKRLREGANLSRGMDTQPVMGSESSRDVESQAWHSALVCLLCEKITIITNMDINRVRHILSLISLCDRKWRVDGGYDNGAGSSKVCLPLN